jgi:hypothetical protein
VGDCGDEKNGRGLDISVSGAKKGMEIDWCFMYLCTVKKSYRQIYSHKRIFSLSRRLNDSR